MSAERQCLPNRRETTRYGLKIHTPTGYSRLYLDVSCYEDGRPGELWLVIEKTGDMLRALMDEIARGASKWGLQRGLPIEDIIKEWLQTKFPPAGVVTGHPHVKFCASPLDAAAKVLQAEFVDQVRATELITSEQGGEP